MAQGMPLLELAVNAGFEGVALALLKGGALTWNSAGPLLKLAIGNGLLRVVKSLITTGAEIYLAHFEAPVLKGNARMVRLLLDNRATYELEEGAELGKWLLNQACQLGHLEVAGMLAGGGADIDGKSNGVTPLESAVTAGQEHIARWLVITEGVDLESPKPLCIAASLGFLGIVRLLVEAGADKDAPLPGHGRGRSRSRGPTPLKAAIEGGHVQVVEYLLSVGAADHTQVPHHPHPHPPT